MTNNKNSGKYFGVRFRSWLRSPRHYLRKAKEKVFGVDTSFFNQGRDSFSPGSVEWLALTETLYGGYQAGGANTKSHIGGDRMSPLHHGYGPCYAEFLGPFISASSSERLTLVEAGILNGNGLATWCDLFPRARVIGLDIDLSNFQANRKRIEELGAFKKNQPEVYNFDQLDAPKAKSILKDVLGESQPAIVIDDGLHSVESISITFDAIRPFLAKKFVYFIEDSYFTYDNLAHRYPEYYWTTRGGITVATSR